MVADKLIIVIGRKSQLSRRGYFASVAGIILSSTAGAVTAESDRAGGGPAQRRFPEWEMIEFREAQQSSVSQQRSPGRMTGRGKPFNDSISLTLEMSASSSITMAYNIRSEKRYDTVSVSPSALTVSRVTEGTEQLLAQQKIDPSGVAGVSRLRLGWSEPGTLRASLRNGVVGYRCQADGVRIQNMGRSDTIGISGSSETQLRMIETGRPEVSEAQPKGSTESLNRKLRQLRRQFGPLSLSFEEKTAVITAGDRRWRIEMEMSEDELTMTDWNGGTHVVSNLSRGEAIRQVEMRRMRRQLQEVQ